LRIGPQRKTDQFLDRAGRLLDRRARERLAPGGASPADFEQILFYARREREVMLALVRVALERERGRKRQSGLRVGATDRHGAGHVDVERHLRIDVRRHDEWLSQIAGQLSHRLATLLQLDRK